MKGYKAFNKGLVCKGKQYAENTVFEEPVAEICNKGMHFCENPLDTLDSYPLLDKNCELSDFASVEALDEAKTDDSKKFVTTKLRIGAKLDLLGFIKASVDFLIERGLADKKTRSQLAASGDESKLAASGGGSQLAASGDVSKLAASGDWSKLAASGNVSQLAASGDVSQLAASGYGSKLAASGGGSKLAASGYGSQLAASGDWSKLAASGGGSKLAASGYGSQLAASGDWSKLALNGKNSVGAAIGYNNKIKGVVGSWITLAEYKDSICVCVKSAQIDGISLKPNTWYTLTNGEFTGE